MTRLDVRQMADKLLMPNFERREGPAAALSDPIADTPMVVTLDELRAYDLNPRVTRNPRYDDLMASIRERGLDAPPAITRRPGEAHFIIRNGGNTRLAILRELWESTGEERFYRIACQFRPWPHRGEIVALTGHLAENELHGRLTFIERAVGVEKARELYEHERGQALSQSELARLLTGDGYPISQPRVSRMQEAVRHLLPAIPTLLHAGLGRPQIERLIALRRAGLRAWEACGGERAGGTSFDVLFQRVLALFDGESPTALQASRVQDELVGRLAEDVSRDYDAVALLLHDAQARHQVLAETPAGSSLVSDNASESLCAPRLASPHRSTAVVAATRTVDTRAQDALVPHAGATRMPDAESESTTPRREAIHKFIDTTAATHGEGHAPAIADRCIEQPHATPEDVASLRADIVSHARTFAVTVGVEGCVQAADTTYGFVCEPAEASAPWHAWTVVALLHGLAASDGDDASPCHLSARDVVALLIGGPRAPFRLTDSALAALVRLIEAMRRVHEHASGDAKEAICPVPTR